MIHFNLSNRPVVFAVIPVIAGVVVGPLMSHLTTTVIFVVIALLSFANFYVLNSTSRLLMVASTIFFIGTLLAIDSTNESIPEEWFGVNRELLVKVATVKNKKDKIILTGSVASEKFKTNVLIQIKDSLDFLPMPGIVVRLNSALRKPGGARTPGGFNYQKYLYNQGIHAVCYPRGHEIKKLISADINLTNISWRLRLVLIEKINNIFGESPSTPLIKGILLGFKEDMSSSDRQLYSTAGIGHVFAVSGMHVGMVYLFCFPLLFFRNMYPWTKFIIPLALLTVVWLFILASGCTPSAVRAGTMISLFEVGKMLHRRIDKWNILAFTALLAIFINPRVLHDIGFQFSYLALVGIFYFYSKFSLWFTSGNLLIKWVYNAIVLSVAAQLTLLPLSLYYFGSFSPYFWLSSLFAMFVVQVNFVLAFFSMALPSDWLLLEFLVNVINYLFTFLNDIILCIMDLPFAALSCKLDMNEVILFYIGLILFMIMWSATNKKRALHICVWVIMLFSCIDAISHCVPGCVQLSLYSSERLTGRLQRGTTFIEFNPAKLIDKKSKISVLNKAISVIDEHTQACSYDTEVLLIKANNLELDFLKDLPNLTHIIVAARLKWKTSNMLQDYCETNEIIYDDLNNNLIKINL